jgi:hypothetical protein
MDRIKKETIRKRKGHVAGNKTSIKLRTAVLLGRIQNGAYMAKGGALDQPACGRLGRYTKEKL